MGQTLIEAGRASSSAEGYTYYCAANGCLRDRSLPVEMVHPDSINDLYIETFPMIGKQMEI
jgi:hypothetical protein